MRWMVVVSLICFGATEVAPDVSRAIVSDPKVTGPIAATVRPGGPSHDYPFGATEADLAKYGYREDEFFIEGIASLYQGFESGTADATIASGPYPYKTRVTVRRPVSARAFNGTVIEEWNNVARGADQENDWLWSHEHLMREGYAYIGVSAQARGIESPIGLKFFSPARYASLDANAGGKIPMMAARALSFDIFSQTAQAAKHPQGVRLLGDLAVRNVIATGHSHGHLYPYYNAIHPLARVIDGFVFHHNDSQMVRTDIKTPAFRLLSELEVRGAAHLDQPDSEYFRTWEVAGAAHADWDLIRVLDPLFQRDLPGPDQTGTCDKPEIGRIPAHLVHEAVYDSMKAWIEKGTAPPHAPRITMTSPGSGGRGGTRGVIARDERGNALGGIRLAQFALPTAVDTGENAGGLFCNILGSHEPFDAATLSRLYPSHAAYVAAVERITNENLKAGYITKAGAEWTIAEARKSTIGARP